MSQRPLHRRVDAVEEKMKQVGLVVDDLMNWLFKNSHQMPNFVKVQYDPMVSSCIAVERLKAVEDPWVTMIEENKESPHLSRVFRQVAEALYPDEQNKGYVLRESMHSKTTHFRSDHFSWTIWRRLEFLCF